MPLEARPLFRGHVVEAALAVFALPTTAEGARQALGRWAGLVRSGRINGFGEQELLPDFLTDVFYGLLGCTGPSAEGAAFSLSRERHVEVDGQFANAVIGRFGSGGSEGDRVVAALLEKIHRVGVPLRECAGVRPLYGVKSGLNEAFLIDTPTRDWLVAEGPGCAAIIRPYLRGQDVKRWRAEWAGLWKIFARRGIEIERDPSVLRHLDRYRAQLEPKPADWTGSWAGRKPGSCRWFERQDPVEYWEEFAKSKIAYQVIHFHSSCALDRGGLQGNDKTFFPPPPTTSIS